MQLMLTVVDAQAGRRQDVLVETEAGDPVATVAESLVATVRGAPVGAGGGDVIALRPPGTALLYVDGQPVDPSLPVKDSPLREGAVVSLDSPDGCLLPEPAGLVELRVVGGPGAGTVVRLGAGSAAVGSGDGCVLRLPEAGLSARALLVEVALDGAATVAAAQPDVLLDGDEVGAQAVPWPPGALLRAGSALLALTTPQPPDAALLPSEDGVGLDYNRPPRLRPPARTTRFRLPTKPTPAERRPLPWLMALLPMLMAFAMAYFFGRWYYLLFGVLSPVMIVGNYMLDRKHGRRSFRRQMQQYREQRKRVEDDAHAALRAERDARRRDCPDPAEVLLIAVGPRRRLWERRRADPDLMLLRVGTADLPSDVLMDDPERPEHDRQVAWTAYDVPVTVPLAERGVLGVAGPGALPRTTARWLVGQAATLHSPQDLRIVVLTEPGGRSDWDWVRWLPHARPAEGQDASVLIGTDTETVARRLAELAAMTTARARARAAAGSGGVLDEPTVLVVLDGARRLRALPGVVQLLREGPRVGVLLVCLDADERLLPEECQAVVVAEGEGLRVSQAGQDPVEGVRPDEVPLAWAHRVARALAPVRDVGQGDDDAALPSSSRLLDVLGLEPPDPEAIAARWTLQRRSTSAVVGESLDGAFAIDLRRDGPHGLIAGTTGAGKSELLQTIVAALAVANTPDEMTFVLIDYKGGSAFKDCVRLPHTVGMVTDLDTHLVERALASLSAELRRREHLLADAGAKDIEDYTDLRIRDASLPALPRLLLVIDEFASMVRELPDFVTGLVNIAQRGRSLGIHLLLATQRPSGVVSPEIRANTNLRIALRVTDNSESSDVIDAPDAARISKSTPGRAYVRLGHSSLVPFQSGRVGGRRPGALAVSVSAPWVAPLEWGALGAPPPRRPQQRVVESDDDATDLSVLVTAIQQAAERLQVPQQPSPWLPALPPDLLLDDLPPAPAGAGPLAPVPFGIEDLPSEQVQRATALDPATFTHLLAVGAPRSGRSQLLRTLAGSVARTHSSADVHLYGIDCGNGALLPLADLPHCGAVVGRTQTERASRLILRLVAEVERRQALLGAGGWADITEQRRAVAEADRLPHVLVLLDRWEGFTSTLGEIDNSRLTDAVMTILREGSSVGVHMVITGDRSLMSGRIAATTEDKLALRLADKTDYTLFGLNPRSLPDDPPPGRAYRAESAIETQIALLDADPSGQAQAAALAEIARAAKERDAGVPRAHRPFRVDVLPASLTFDQAWEMRDPAAGPLFALVGVGGDELVAHGPDLAAGVPSFIVGGPAKSGRSTVLLTMATSLLRSGCLLAVAAPKPSPLRRLEGTEGVVAVWTGDDVREDALEAVLTAAGDTPLVVVVDDAELLKDADAKDTLRRLVKGQAGPHRAVVLGGNAEDLSSGFSGWQVEARKARQGALLSPQSLSDGDVIGTKVPRSSIGGQITPGRALLHLGDGQLLVVQVPTPST